MNSLTSFSTILLALIAITNAYECRPQTCMIHCPYGFDVDTQGCPICNCRRTLNICIEPISGYNCGLINRDCPSSHECQFDFSGLSGQCCLKRLDSSTASAQSTNHLGATGTTTTRLTTTTTTKPRTTTTTKPRTTTITKHHITTTTKRPTTKTTKRHTTTRHRLNRLFSV
jgi:hypothetical protein